MRRAVITAPKTIELQETNIPEIRPDEVLVKVKAVGFMYL